MMWTCPDMSSAVRETNGDLGRAFHAIESARSTIESAIENVFGHIFGGGLL